MAVRTKKTVNRSRLIRDYLKEHPEASNPEAAKALSKHGVTSGLVSSVRSFDSRKTKKKRRTSVVRTKPTAEQTAAAIDNIVMSTPLPLTDARTAVTKHFGGDCDLAISAIRELKTLQIN